MWQIEPNFVVRLGDNRYINTPDLIAYRGESLFRLRRCEDGMLGIDFDVFDATGKRIAKFAKGIVVHGDVGNYEITSGHEAYVVTERASGQVAARVQRRNVEGAELDVWVRTYLPNGFLLEAGPDQTNLGGTVMRGTTIKDGRVGIAIG